MIHLKKSTWHLFTLGIIAILLTVTLSACGNKSTEKSSTNNDIKVIASVDFYGEVAKKILGNAGTVTSIIDSPNVDLHDYEPTTKVATAITKANVILTNGIGYDDWVDKLAKNNSTATKIEVGEDILKKHDGDNPHLWYQLKTMPAVAKYLANKFSKMNPKKADYYQANADKYIESLKPISTLVAKLKANSNHKLVDVSEPVFNYALADLGYRQNNKSFSESVENGTDPAPKAVADMQNDITNHKIAFFVQNTQATSKTVS